MLQLARLVGRTLAEKKTQGKRRISEVLSVALRETDREDFRTADRDALRGILDEQNESLTRSERLAARSVLLRGGLARWHGIRRYAPHPTLVEIVIWSFQAALIVSVALWLGLLGLTNFALGLGFALPDASRTFGVLALLIVVATVCSFAAARNTTSGLSRRISVFLDAICVGVLAGAAGFLVLLVIGWSKELLILDLETSFPRAISPVALALVFLVFAAPTLGATRALLRDATVAASRFRLVTGVIGWPLSLATIVALVFAKWADEPLAELANLGWLISATCLISAAITMARADAESTVVFEPKRQSFFLDGAIVAGQGALAVVVILLVGIGYAMSARTHGRNVAPLFIPNVDATEKVPIVFNSPVTLVGDPRAWIQLAIVLPRSVSDAVLTVRNSAGGMRDLILVSRRGLPAPAVANLMLRDPTVEVCLTPLSSFQGQQGCGIPNVGPASVLSILVGSEDPVARPVTAAGDAAQLIVLRYQPPRTIQVSIDAETIAAWRRGEKASITRSLEGTPENRVWRIDVPGRVHLSAELSNKDDPRDRMIVIQSTSRVQAVSEIPDPPRLTVDLDPGTYQICARMFNAFFQRCDGPSYELLSERINLSLSVPEGRP